jgi:hypothetical protein
MQVIWGALAAMMLAASTAGAATTIYYHSGSWDAFSGTDAENQVVCGIATENTADGRSLELSFVIGGDALYFQATKPSWSIPNGTQVPLVMQIGSSQPWNEQATGHGTSLVWSMARSDTPAFRQQFRRASSMTLTFPSGNEPPWTVSLIGSTAVDNTFALCIRDQASRQQAQQPAARTQPFGQAGATSTPTQPFGQGTGNVAPTQPNAAPTQPSAAPTQPAPAQ